MPAIAAATRMGAVHLTVADLARSLDYYERVVGLHVQQRNGNVAHLGTGGEDLLVLHEEPGAEPAPRNTGLFHFALLLPTRHDLARWLAHAANNQIRLEGMSDHLVSEALYLRDPDWHGIEIYRDRPRAEWERDGEFVKMATLPLDVEGVLSALDGGEGEFEHMPLDTTMGHVHLQVADIPAAESFYSELLGFDLQARYGDQASFLSAGGYHHHLGANTWRGEGVGPAPAGTVGLREWTLVLEPDALAAIRARLSAAGLGDGDVVEDPWGIRLRLVASG
jgi:catechol 2,3-dioxygenase